MKRTVGCLLTVSCCAMVQGCATEYVGGAGSGPPGQAATISASSRAWRLIPDAMTAAASIDSVDGQKTSASASKVSVAPGHHTLAVTCRWGFRATARFLSLYLGHPQGISGRYLGRWPPTGRVRA